MLGESIWKVFLQKRLYFWKMVPLYWSQNEVERETNFAIPSYFQMFRVIVFWKNEPQGYCVQPTHPSPRPGNTGDEWQFISSSSSSCLCSNRVLEKQLAMNSRPKIRWVFRFISLDVMTQVPGCAVRSSKSTQRVFFYQKSCTRWSQDKVCLFDRVFSPSLSHISRLEITPNFSPQPNIDFSHPLPDTNIV